LVQEEQKERHEKEQEAPEENRQESGVDDPSLMEEPESPEQEEQIAEAEEEGSEEEIEEKEPDEEPEEEPPFTEELAPRRGCFWGCLLPVVTIVAVLLITVTVIQMRWGDAISKWMRHKIIANTQNNILGSLPEDMDDKEIKATFEEVEKAIDEDMIDAEMLDETIKAYQEATQGKTSQKKQAISDLMEGLNAAIIKPEALR
jgi:hypothetical protein